MLFAQQVPMKIQAVIFKKMFPFIKSLKTAGVPKVLIVFNDANATQKDELVEEFTKLGISVGAVRSGQIASVLANYNVLYYMPGCASGKNPARNAGMISLGGEIGMAERGECSVALADENGKPRIVVNARSLKSEGQEIAAEVLKISRIIE